MRSMDTKQMGSQKTLLLGKAGEKTALKAAGSATLKLPPSTATLKTGYDADRTMKPLAKAGTIDTVWDESTVTSNQTRKLQSLSKKVDKMQGNFEGVTRMKEEKRQMMDDMHEHTMDKVEETRLNMEKLLAEVAQHIKEFSEEWRINLADATDNLDDELRMRLAQLNAKYQAVEERTRRLAKAIDNETQSRFEHIESVLVPAREQAARLESELATEREIRTNREAEIKEHMEDCVRVMEETLRSEKTNRIDRHDLAVKDVIGEARDEQSVDDRTSDLPRLRRRYDAIVKKDDATVADFHKDIDEERKLRVAGQDHIVDQINMFIKRFQDHVLEEGEMGD